MKKILLICILLSLMGNSFGYYGRKNKDLRHDLISMAWLEPWLGFELLLGDPKMQLLEKMHDAGYQLVENKIKEELEPQEYFFWHNPKHGYEYLETHNMTILFISVDCYVMNVWIDIEERLDKLGSTLKKNRFKLKEQKESEDGMTKVKYAQKVPLYWPTEVRFDYPSNLSKKQIINFSLFIHYGNLIALYA